jgi:nicotinamide mononucleotide transporter PnuC
MGGVGLFAALVACVFGARLLGNPHSRDLAALLVCSLPAVAFGLAEDITRRVSSRRRLLAAACSAGLGIFLMEAVINRVDVSLIDSLLVWSVVSIPLTLFAVSGIANSVNIIDGFNGLASMVSLMMFVAIAYVATQVGDRFIVIAALACIGAILGFFIWNFPLGIANGVLLLFLFLESRLFADSGLQVMFIVLNARGWWLWKFGAQTAERPVTRAPARELRGALAASLLLSALLGGLLWLARGSVPVFDGTIAGLSVVAQWLLNRKRLENWLWWIVVDLVSIPVYLYKQLYLIALLYLLFLGICAIGYRGWRREASGAGGAAGAPAAP